MSAQLSRYRHLVAAATDATPELIEEARKVGRTPQQLNLDLAMVQRRRDEADRVASIVEQHAAMMRGTAGDGDDFLDPDNFILLPDPAVDPPVLPQPEESEVL